MHSQVSQACKLSIKMWHWIGQQVWPNISSHAQAVIPSLHSRPFLVPVQFPITVLRLSIPKDSEAVPRFPHLGMTTWVPSCLGSTKWDLNYPSRTMCPGSKLSWLEPQSSTEKAKMPKYIDPKLRHCCGTASLWLREFPLLKNLNCIPLPYAAVKQENEGEEPPKGKGSKTRPKKGNLKFYCCCSSTQWMRAVLLKYLEVVQHILEVGLPERSVDGQRICGTRTFRASDERAHDRQRLVVASSLRGARHCCSAAHRWSAGCRVMIPLPCGSWEYR